MTSFVLRPATMEDAELLLRWANDPVTRSSGFHGGQILPDEHRAWLAARLASSATRLFIGTVDGAPAGQIRLERGVDGLVEISLSVAPELRGHGLGRLLLEHGLAAGMADARLDAAGFIARVRPDNTASLALFSGAGFVETGRVEVNGLTGLVFSLARRPASAGRTPAAARLRILPPVIRRVVPGSGWLPAAGLAMITTLVLVRYGTPVGAIASFGLYIALGVALPGILLVRLARGGPGHIAEDVTLGLAVGYAMELGSYLVARAAGVPLLFLVWPVATLAAFALVPGLRRHWRGSGVRAPAWWSWSLAGLLAFVLWYSAGTFFAQHALSGTYIPYVDMPYHLSLLGELRHHVPPQVPYLIGAPLAYHWFFYAEAAATSWATGIEPVVLLYRLSMLPMVVAFVVLTAATARRLTGGWWSGPAAVALALLGVVTAPYAAIPASVFDTQTIPVTWLSPTNEFGLALFAALLLMFVDLVTSEGPVPRRRWLLAGLLVLAAAGAKATLMPLLGAGMVTVVVVTAVARHGLNRAALGGLVLAAGGLLLAVKVLFHGSTGGVVVGLGSLRMMPIAQAVGAPAASGLASVVVPLVVLAVAATLWSFLWAGAFGLLARRRWTPLTPGVLLLAGVCASAIGAVVLLLYYPGLSEIYYMRSAAGAFAILAVAGVAALLPADADRRRLVTAVAVAALVGALAVVLIVAVGPARLPSLPGRTTAKVLLAVVLPIAGLALVAAAGAVVARGVVRRDPRLAGTAPILFVALVMGFSLPAVAHLAAAPLSPARVNGPAISGEAIDAARWLRDHSSPDDLVATNLHCRVVTAASGCDTRQFWVSGYSERRMLIESSGAPPVVEAVKFGDSTPAAVPAWEQQLLALNDRAFTAPTADALSQLRGSYGVRWLFADLATANGAALGRYATLRFQSGGYAVYELPG